MCMHVFVYPWCASSASHSVIFDSLTYGLQSSRLLCLWNSPGKNTGVGCHFLLQCMRVKSESEVTQSCPTLCDPTDCNLPGSSILGIFQARVLERGAIAFSESRYILSPFNQRKPRLIGLPKTHQNKYPTYVCEPKEQCSSNGQQWLYGNLDGGKEKVGAQKLNISD